MADKRFITPTDIGGPSGIGVDFVRQLLESTKPPAKSASVPTTKTVIPTATPQADEFLNSIIPAGQAAQGEEETEALNLNDIKMHLESTGFESNPQTVEKFLEKNSLSNPVIDYSEIPRQDDPEKVAPLGEVVRDSILAIPAFQVMLGLIKPLEVISEGFKRYEAFKTEFGLGGFAAGGIKPIQGLLGQAKTDFPDATMRASDYPELGDLFRKMGIPEPISSTAGFAVDVLTDIPLMGLAGLGIKKGIKTGFQSVDKIIDQVPEATKLKAHLMKWRSNQFVKEIEEAALGKSRYHEFDAQIREQIMKTTTVSNRLAAEMTNIGSMLTELATDKTTKFLGFKFHKINPAKLSEMHEALFDVTSPQFLKQPKAVQEILAQGRKAMDDLSESWAQELENLIKLSPELEERLLSKAPKFGAAGDIKNTLDFLNSIRANKGHYLKSMYRMFADKAYIPEKTAQEAFVKGYMKDANVAEDVARAYMNKRMNDRFVDIGDSFRKRNNLPEYWRNFLGEIKDPRYVLAQQARYMSENIETLKLYNLMYKAGLFSEAQTAKHVYEAPKTGSGAWNLFSGMYTTPDVKYLLDHVQKSSNAMDKAMLTWMSAIKGAKTVFNPKTHVHNPLGNFMFSFLDGVTMFNNPKVYKDSFNIIKAGEKYLTGQLTKSDPLVAKYLQAVEDGILGTEFASADAVKFLQSLLKDPYELYSHGKVFEASKQAGQFAAKAYSWEDQLFKLASYLHKTDTLKMARPQAIEEVYRWYPNYLEATKIANRARNSAAGVFMANPFLTFRLESHRIAMNAFKEPEKALIMATMMGHRLAWNTAMLASTGHSLSEITQLYLTRPEAVSELILNPVNPDFDLNTEYLDPFNTNGMFAPLLALSGASGVNPFDYLLDFSAFSPEFGYQQLITNVLEPALTGRGQYNQELDFQGVLGQTVKALGPSSFTTDLPKIVSPEEEGERLRRSLRFFGIDVEKRNPEYIRNKIRGRLKQKIAKGQDTTEIMRVIETLGFNADRMQANLLKDVKRGKIQVKKREDSIDKFLDFLNL